MFFSAALRLCLAFLLLLSACKRLPPPDTLVTVNGEAITEADLDGELAMQGQQARSPLQGQQARTSDRDAVLEDLIDQVQVLQEASGNGVKLSPDDLENQILLARAGTPIKEFKEALAARGLGYAQWRERVRRQALCDEVLRRQIRSQLIIKRQDLKDYYWEHVTQFRRPPSVKLRQIYCKTRSNAEKASNELALGESFEAVAARYSQGPEASSGGELGWMSRKMLPAKLAQAAFALKKGQCSPIVASAYGYHILRVDERREEEAMSLDEAAPDIHESLLREREQGPYRDWLFELRSHAEIKRLDFKGKQK